MSSPLERQDTPAATIVPRLIAGFGSLRMKQSPRITDSTMRIL